MRIEREFGLELSKFIIFQSDLKTKTGKRFDSTVLFQSIWESFKKPNTVLIRFRGNGKFWNVLEPCPSVTAPCILLHVCTPSSLKQNVHDDDYIEIELQNRWTIYVTVYPLCSWNEKKFRNYQSLHFRAVPQLNYDPISQDGAVLHINNWFHFSNLWSAFLKCMPYVSLLHQDRWIRWNILSVGRHSNADVFAVSETHTKGVSKLSRYIHRGEASIILPQRGLKLRKFSNASCAKNTKRILLLYLLLTLPRRIV